MDLKTAYVPIGEYHVWKARLFSSDCVSRGDYSVLIFWTPDGELQARIIETKDPDLLGLDVSTHWGKLIERNEVDEETLSSMKSFIKLMDL